MRDDLKDAPEQAEQAEQEPTKEQEMNDYDLFVPEEPEFWEAQLLTPRNTARFLRLTSGVITTMGLSVRDIFPEDVGSLTGPEVMNIVLTAMQALDGNVIVQYASIAIDQPPDEVRSNWNFAKATKALVKFVEINELVSMLGEVLPAARDTS